MARLIDANALIKEANADGAYGYVDALQIANAPTVDAVEVVHAEWEEIDGDYRCTNCHHAPIVGIDNEFRLTNFCPNCGAKMDGESEG